MTAAPERTFIPDIVEEHYDELQFLWTQRRNALRSPAYTERELGMLEERIEAHVEGMLVVGAGIGAFVNPGLAGEDEMPAFGASFALLRLGTPDAEERVIDALRTATGPKLAGLRDALAHAPATRLAPQLVSFFETAAPAVGAAAGEALAFHGLIAPSAVHLERFIRADDPLARSSAWRLAAYCGVSLPAPWYEAGLRDDDPAVSGAALVAAAWNASPAFLPHCRRLAASPTPESIGALVMLACVAPPDEYRLLEALVTSTAAGPERFRVLGSFAHPYFIDLLIAEMSNPDPAAAAAAGAAFTKMTGRDVESDRRAKVSASGKPPADEFEAEFLDEIFLPDPDRARRHWHELAPGLARSPRICRGMDVSRPLSREQFAALDMESRWEHCLRARLFGGWQGTPLVLERYPQRF